MLPEEVLLEIFDFYLCEVYNKMEWKTLVHVCRRWRSIVLAAPLRLDLRLVCTDITPVRKMLGIWPALPIALRFFELTDEALAALQYRDRICEIYLGFISDYKLKSLAEATRQAPFPALTDLRIEAFGGWPVVPDSLLGGSAPGLRSLSLRRAAFPALGKLLLSAPRLVELSLCDIRGFAIINSETMADWLPSLTGLVKLQIEYRNKRPIQFLLHRPSNRPPPLTRPVLPVLTTLTFKCGSDYLDPPFSHLDTPLLKHVNMEFVYPAIFDFSKISPFIGHKESFEEFDQAQMLWYCHFQDVCLRLSSRKGTIGGMWLELRMAYGFEVWHLRSLSQVHHPFAEPPSESGNFDYPYPDGGHAPSWDSKTGNGQWLELLRFFTAVEILYLSVSIARFVAPVLRELAAGESAATARDVLPALQTLFVEKLDLSESGPVREAVGGFVAARKLSGHPVAVHHWVCN